MPRETFRVERGRRDDHLEIGPLLAKLLQVPQQEVDVEAALVRFVDDDRVVGQELAIALRLGQQDAIGHQLDVGVWLRMVGEAHLVPDGLAHRLRQLLGDARRDRARGDPARLRVADQAALAAARGQADLGQLRRLARPGLAADDDHLVRADRLRDFIGPLRDRQVRRIGDRGLRRGARRALCDRTLEIGGQAGPFRFGRTLRPGATDPRRLGALRRGPWPAAGGP